MVFIVARLRALGRAAAAALVGAFGADAGVAGPFLPKQLFGAAGNFAAAQGGMRAGPLVGQVHEHHFMKKLLVDLAAEFGRIDLHGADSLALAVHHVKAQRLRIFPGKSPRYHLFPNTMFDKK